MKPLVGVIAPGAMGSAVAKRLVENGLKILTVLEGRSAETVKRARAAGMSDARLAEIAAADMILSIVPPGEALGLAQHLAPAMNASARKPVYVDCNAVSPETAVAIGRVVSATGARFVDAGIIGGPPKADYNGPVFYLSGEHAREAMALKDYGLVPRLLDDKIGTASALKMSYGGITKGLTALASAMMLAASRADVGPALKRELKESQPQLLAWFERQVPSMYAKAYRWVAEMEEVSEFARDDKAAQAMFQSFAELYTRLAHDFSGTKTEAGMLNRFFES
jgi:3-hydroxyisobutyrate dehydrogenase-like beta-hydroxyacid dehydrogenase